MILDAWLPWILSVALLSVRLTVAFALSPALSSFGLPAMVRVALTIALAVLIFASRAAPEQAAMWATDPLRLLQAAAAELGLGALLGLSVHVVFAGFAIAGRMLDVQIGFAIGSTFDPITRTRADIIGALLSLLAVTIFFASDAYLELIRLLARSLDLFPLGQLPALNDPIRPLLAAGWMYSLGFALAAPLVMTLLLTDITVGVLSRNMPQLNVLVLSIPIKVLIGYLVLSFTSRGWAPLIHRDFDRMAELIGVR
jgi:flagellar biosynthesis protein FliR